ncbi:hypothetical protein ACFL3D_00565 [Candidatus Omnitrophota bacterium]
MLQAFFSSKTRVALLNLFFRNPERRYYLREISRLLSESLTPIRRELLNLKKIGLLKDAKLANLIYYQLDKEFILFDELKSMVIKTQKHEVNV